MSESGARLALQGCLDRGVCEFVVCAGARNAALVLALSRLEGVPVWNHFEERSAGFFALGRCMAHGRPVGVVTTSGTAAAELLPAVIEAHYQGRPLVVLTADRPAAYRGSGAPQAIEQVGLFGNYVEGCEDVRPGGACRGADRDGEEGERGVEGRGVLEGWSGGRPWHLNICLEEKVAVPELVVPAEAPDLPRGRRPGVIELVDFLRGDVFRGLVVLLGGLEEDEREAALHFLKDLGVPVLADATSGLREALGGQAMVDGDALLRSNPPGLVLRLGDVPVGRFWRDLEELPEVEVLSITRTGFSGLARKSGVITGRVSDAVRGLGEAPPIGDVLDLRRRAGKRAGWLDELLERYPDSEPAMVRELSTIATIGGSVFLGNSLPIREWNLCAQRSVPVATVRANRGANGIDGQLSTWLGATAGEDGALGVFGDLTVLYDLSAPALMEQCGGPGRVLAVINNGGGRIFERLPHLQGLADRERAVIANAHGRKFGEWAAMWGMNHVAVTAREEFDWEPGETPLVVELRPDAVQSEAFWREWSDPK